VQISPKNKREWVSLLLLPFRAYVIICPVMILVGHSLPHPRDMDDEAYIFMVESLCYDGFILLFLALIVTLTGPKGLAFPTVAFGLAAFVLFLMIAPALCVR
jgi:hypothetical protein